MGGVEVDAQLHILGVDDVAGERELDTPVVHVTDVVVVSGITDGRGGREPEEHIGGVAVEEFEAAVQDALEEGELETGVEVGVGLPGDVGITLLLESHGDLAGGRSDGVGVGVLVGTDVVVALATVGSLQFEHINPGSVEPGFLVDDPGAAHAPEVTPAAGNREVGRSVATEGSAGEILALIVGLCTGEVTLDIVLAHGGTGGGVVLDGTVEFLVVLGIHVLLAGAQGVALEVVVLVAEHQADVEFSEALVVVQDLLRVECGRAGVLLAHGTLGGSELSVVRILDGGVAVFVDVLARVEGELEVLEEGDVRSAVGVDGIALGVAGIHPVGEQRVGVGHERTGQAAVHTVTVVHHLEAPLVDLHFLVGGTNPQRVDRSHPGSEGPDVRGGVGSSVVAEGIAVIAGVGQVAIDLEPALGLIVCLQTAGETALVGVRGDTFVLEITHGSVEVGAVGARSDAHVVFPAVAGTVCGVAPVVGRDPVLLTGGGIGDLLAERGLGVHLAIETDEIFAGRDGVHLVSEAADVLVAGDDAVDRDVRSLGGHPFLVTIVIVEREGVCLIVSGNARDVVVLLQGLDIDALFDVDGHHGIVGLAALGGDDDDTVGATGAVERIGGSVLEDGHALDISGIDAADGAVIRHAVDDIQRVLAGIQGAEATDADGRSGPRSAGGLSQLDAGDLARKGGRDGAHLCLGEFFRFHDFRRSGEGLLGGRTESDDDGLVQHRGVLGENHVDRAPAVHRDLLLHESDGGENQSGIGGDADGVLSVDIGGGTLLGAIHDNGCRRDRVACSVGHDTRDRDVLSICGKPCRHCGNSHKKKELNFSHKPLD